MISDNAKIGTGLLFLVSVIGWLNPNGHGCSYYGLSKTIFKPHSLTFWFLVRCEILVFSYFSGMCLSLLGNFVLVWFRSSGNRWHSVPYWTYSYNRWELMIKPCCLSARSKDKPTLTCLSVLFRQSSTRCFPNVAFFFAERSPSRNSCILWWDLSRIYAMGNVWDDFSAVWTGVSLWPIFPNRCIINEGHTCNRSDISNPGSGKILSNVWWRRR